MNTVAPAQARLASRAWVGLVCALVGAVAFSGKAVIIKLAYRHGVDAITLLGIRMLMALPMFVLIGWWAGRDRPPLDGRERLAVLVLGFTGYYLSSTLDFLGLTYVSASLERLILYLMPTIVLLLNRFAFGRRVAVGQWVALAVSYAGVMVVFGHELTLEGRNVVLGSLLVFGSAFSYSIYMIGTGEWVRRIGTLRLTGWTSTVACALCVLQFLVVRPLSAAVVAEPVLWLSLLNATACTVAPVLLVAMAVERIGASTTTQLGLVGPVSTILLSVVFLGEAFTPWVAAGTGLVLAGVWLLSRVRARALG